MQFWPPDDEHMCSKHVEAWNTLIVKQNFGASSWLNTQIKWLICCFDRYLKHYEKRQPYNMIQLGWISALRAASGRQNGQHIGEGNQKVKQVNHRKISWTYSNGMCRMRRLLAVLRSFFHFSLLCTSSCHSFKPTILPSSLTSSCHLFLGLSLNLVVPKFKYNTFLGILFPSILCTWPTQRNQYNLIDSIIVGFF